MENTISVSKIEVPICALLKHILVVHQTDVEECNERYRVKEKWRKEDKFLNPFLPSNLFLANIEMELS